VLCEADSSCQQTVSEGDRTSNLLRVLGSQTDCRNGYSAALLYKRNKVPHCVCRNGYRFLSFLRSDHLQTDTFARNLIKSGDNTEI
jgi:hypothetical protein